MKGSIVLRGRSTRELQAFGAACVAAFVSSFGLMHPSISALVEHLLKALTTDDLPAWDSAGSCLSLSARGEPIPKELSSEIPSALLQTFTKLLQVVVEIGLVDMYGANTDEPRRFAAAAIEILESNNVVVPSPEEVLGAAGTAVSGWGEPLSDGRYDQARHWCLTELARISKRSGQ